MINKDFKKISAFDNAKKSFRKDMDICGAMLETEKWIGSTQK